MDKGEKRDLIVYFWTTDRHSHSDNKDGAGPIGSDSDADNHMGVHRDDATLHMKLFVTTHNGTNGQIGTAIDWTGAFALLDLDQYEGFTITPKSRFSGIAIGSWIKKEETSNSITLTGDHNTDGLEYAADDRQNVYGVLTIPKSGLEMSYNNASDGERHSNGANLGLWNITKVQSYINNASSWYDY